MKKTLFIVIGLALFGLVACQNTSREPKAVTSQLTGVYTVELWSEHEYYDLGETIHLRATLNNVSKDTVTFKSKDVDVPALDIEVRTPGPMRPGEGEMEERIWSKENLDQVKYVIVLSPGESYSIEWILNLNTRNGYDISAQNIDPRDGERFSTGMIIEHGIRLGGGAP